MRNRQVLWASDIDEFGRRVLVEKRSVHGHGAL